MPRLLSALGSSLGYKDKDQLVSFNKTLEKTAYVACNINDGNVEWKIAMLFITHGGIGLATSIDTALSTYAASLTASLYVADRFPTNVPESNLSSKRESVCQIWTTAGFDVVA